MTDNSRSASTRTVLAFPIFKMHNAVRNVSLLFLLVGVSAIACAVQSTDSLPPQGGSTTPQSQQASTPPAQSQQPPARAAATITLPVGTKLPLGLVRPISVNHSKAGDSAYLQITFPVTVGGEMVIPPGTYVQGEIEKIIKRDRARERLEFEMRSTSLIFSTGYTVEIAGTVYVAPGTAQLRTPAWGGNGQGVPAMAATGTTTPTLPPLPSMGNGARNAMIGLGVAAAAGTTLAIVLANHGGSDIEMAAGTPVQIVLTAPLQLDRNRVIAAVQQYSGQVATAQPPIVQPPVKPKMCYDPGTPGTPDTVIPGTPGTPDTVIPGANGAPPTVIPGTPATPPTVIPGSPGTPARQYPCK